MMINKRLIGTVAESKKYIAGNVILQWCSLTANIALMLSISRMLAELFRGSASVQLFTVTGIVVILALAVRFFCSIGAAKMGYFSSKAVKKSLREKIYQKLLRLGSSYNEQVKTSEVVQVAVEGVDQLETYFGAYLPQFFYAMLAPLTLFIVLCFVNVAAAVVLLICVPLIPVAIAAVQTWAKKLLSKYWGQYTELGDTFLENLQGLTTLKIYQADAFKQQEMNEQAEKFRKITMKVLTMQLNSITIMDLIAYGGAALGVIMAVTQYQSGGVSLEGCLLIILLAADFFIPMRQLGSFFHIAMNGMAASDKIFRLLDLEETKPEITESFPSGHTIRCSGLSFSYEPDRPVLEHVSFRVRAGEVAAFVGETGAGKTTLVNLLIRAYEPTAGEIRLDGVPLGRYSREGLSRCFSVVLQETVFFRGTVLDNLRYARPEATEAEVVHAAKLAHAHGFIQRLPQGYQTLMSGAAGEFSQGQYQLLAMARALVSRAPILILDEATSSVDTTTEQRLQQATLRLLEGRTCFLIAHRPSTIRRADRIFVVGERGIVESGTYDELMKKRGVYWSVLQ